MPEDISVEEAQQAIKSTVWLPDTNDVTRTSHRGRPRISYDDLPDNVMTLAEQIKVISKRIRRLNMPHKEFMDLNRLLNELRSQMKARHPRSANGVNLQEIQRKEARDKRKALAANKETDHGTE